jgi:hypothetical protein
VPRRDDKNFDRIIDANFNRAKEGLRVCEDICRFILDAKNPTRNYKIIRHELTRIMKASKFMQVICSRDIAGDVGSGSTIDELKRRDWMDIFYANSQRIKESIRVLEEFAKLRHKRFSGKLKVLRYKIYALEKNIIERCQAVSDPRQAG